MPWILALTKPNCEAIAAENLLRQKFDYYLPRFHHKPPNKKWSIKPLFPRYIFILIDRVWYPLLGTRGISRVLMADFGPQTVPASAIATLRSREDEKGLVLLTPKPKFLPGDKVKAEQGPMAGHVMFYDCMTAKDRVRVLIEMLGMRVPVEIEEKMLVAA